MFRCFVESCNPAMCFPTMQFSAFGGWWLLGWSNYYCVGPIIVNGPGVPSSHQKTSLGAILLHHHHHPRAPVTLVETIIVDNLLTKRCKTSPIKVWWDSVWTIITCERVKKGCGVETSGIIDTLEGGKWWQVGLLVRHVAEQVDTV